MGRKREGGEGREIDGEKGHVGRWGAARSGSLCPAGAGGESQLESKPVPAPLSQ